MIESLLRSVWVKLAIFIGGCVWVLVIAPSVSLGRWEPLITLTFLALILSSVWAQIRVAKAD